MRISAGTVVAFRYIMYDQSGTVLQDNPGTAPVVYLHGSGPISEGLQHQMEGLQSGSEAWLHLHDQTGEYRFNVFIQSVRAATNAELEVGYPVQPDQGCNADCECFNQLK